jgi:hypothetical protein
MFTINEKKGFVTHDRESLRSVPVPTVADLEGKTGGWVPTERWKPIAHGAFVDQVVESAEMRGFDVESERWQTSADGFRLYGSIDFTKSSEGRHPQIDLPDGVGLALGIIHANDGSRAATIAVGARVFVCSNGMITGEFVFSRKHTSGLDLGETVEGAIDRFATGAREIPKTIEDLRSIPLDSTRTTDHLLVSMGRRGVLPWSQIGKVEKEWREPRHPEFEPRNAWSFYNATTEVAKGISIRKQAGVLVATRELLLDPFYTSPERN